MVWLPAPWTPKMPYEPPDSITIEQFVMDDQWRTIPLRTSRPPFSHSTGKNGRSGIEVIRRVDHLSRALSRMLDWHPKGAERDKVMAIFSINTVRSPQLTSTSLC